MSSLLEAHYSYWPIKGRFDSNNQVIISWMNNYLSCFWLVCTEITIYIKLLFWGLIHFNFQQPNENYYPQDSGWKAAGLIWGLRDWLAFRHKNIFIPTALEITPIFGNTYFNTYFEWWGGTLVIAENLPPEIQLPHRWELRTEDSVHLRNTASKKERNSMPTSPQDHVIFSYSTSKIQATPVAHIHITLLHSRRGANLLWNLLQCYSCLANLSVYDLGTLAPDDLIHVLAWLLTTRVLPNLFSFLLCFLKGRRITSILKDYYCCHD